jgi:hypothetical protein
LPGIAATWSTKRLQFGQTKKTRSREVINVRVAGRFAANCISTSQVGQGGALMVLKMFRAVEK